MVFSVLETISTMIVLRHPSLSHFPPQCPQKKKKKSPKNLGVSVVDLYINHSAYILVSAAIQRSSPRFSRNSIFWENAAVKFFRELYFSGSFWFRKVWCWLSSQWDTQTANEVYNHEKCRLSRKIWSSHWRRASQSECFENATHTTMSHKLLSSYGLNHTPYFTDEG